MLAIAQAAQREHWPERLQARIACVISNRPQAAGLAKAAELGLATQVVDHTLYENQSHPREAFDSALMQAIDAHQPSLVVLAGFMRILTPGFVVHYQGRLLNIHPSLLPAFTGLNTHQRAIDAACQLCRRHGAPSDGGFRRRADSCASRGAGVARRHGRQFGVACTHARALDIPTSDCRVAKPPTLNCAANERLKIPSGRRVCGGCAK